MQSTEAGPNGFVVCAARHRLFSRHGHWLVTRPEPDGRRLTATGAWVARGGSDRELRQGGVAPAP